MVAKLVHIAYFAFRLLRKDRIVIIFDNGIVQLVAQTPVKIKRRKVDLRQLHQKKIHVPIALVCLVVHEAQGVDLFRR